MIRFGLPVQSNSEIRLLSARLVADEQQTFRARADAIKLRHQLPRSRMEQDGR